MERKTIVRVFQKINWQNFTQKDLDIIKIGKPYKRN